MECVEVAWSPDGRTLAIVGGIGHIVLFTPNGRRIRVLTRPRNGGRIVWSPDSKRLAISTDKGLYAVPVNGSGPRPLLSARKLAVLHWGAEMILFDKRAVHSRNPNSTRITKLFALPTPLQDLAWRRVP